MTMGQNPLAPSALAALMVASVGRSAAPQLRNAYDAVALFSHACMLAVEFRLVGLGEDHKIGRKTYFPPERNNTYQSTATYFTSSLSYSQLPHLFRLLFLFSVFFFFFFYFPWRLHCVHGKVSAHQLPQGPAGAFLPNSPLREDEGEEQRERERKDTVQ
jgi:hypothetical protein